MTLTKRWTGTVNHVCYISMHQMLKLSGSCVVTDSLVMAKAATSWDNGVEDRKAGIEKPSPVPASCVERTSCNGATQHVRAHSKGKPFSLLCIPGCQFNSIRSDQSTKAAPPVFKLYSFPDISVSCTAIVRRKPTSSHIFEPGCVCTLQAPQCA